MNEMGNIASKMNNHAVSVELDQEELESSKVGLVELD